MYKRLSYNLNDQAPGWPNNPKIELKPKGLISTGGSSNSYLVTLFNHFGSHMDAPKHFNDDGPAIAELPFDRFIFHKPLLLDIPKSFKEGVMPEDLMPHAEKIGEADLLMIRSGFSQYRETDPDRYSKEGPYVSSDACRYLMDHFKNLSGLAVDWVSLASPSNNDGKLAHQHLLKNYDHFVTIIEDIDMRGLKQETLRKVFSIPLFIDGIDSSPVTVFAEIAT
ncbi:MAG TPA: cyclase family protein [Fastidiosipila sp.]|nr:cyclase family protein [Fastidiosipila sp.]